MDVVIMLRSIASRGQPRSIIQFNRPVSERLAVEQIAKRAVREVAGFLDAYARRRVEDQAVPALRTRQTVQQCAVQPPNSQSWTLLDGCLGVLAIAAACGAAYGAAQFTTSSWIIFSAFAVTMALSLAGIVNNQTKRQMRQEEEYAAWLERRIGATTSRTTRSQ